MMFCLGLVISCGAGLLFSVVVWCSMLNVNDCGVWVSGLWMVIVSCVVISLRSRVVASRVGVSISMDLGLMLSCFMWWVMVLISVVVLFEFGVFIMFSVLPWCSIMVVCFVLSRSGLDVMRCLRCSVIAGVACSRRGVEVMFEILLYGFDSVGFVISCSLYYGVFIRFSV